MKGKKRALALRQHRRNYAVWRGFCLRIKASAQKVETRTFPPRSRRSSLVYNLSALLNSHDKLSLLAGCGESPQIPRAYMLAGPEIIRPNFILRID
jgi:hypothetical protein